MNRGLWISRKNYLFSLMKKVYDSHGGKSPDEFQEHFHQVLVEHPDEKIEEAVACFEGLVEQLQYK